MVDHWVSSNLPFQWQPKVLSPELLEGCTAQSSIEMTRSTETSWYELISLVSYGRSYNRHVTCMKMGPLQDDCFLYSRVMFYYDDWMRGTIVIYSICSLKACCKKQRWCSNVWANTQGFEHFKFKQHCIANSAIDSDLSLCERTSVAGREIPGADFVGEVQLKQCVTWQLQHVWFLQNLGFQWFLSWCLGCPAVILWQHADLTRRSRCCSGFNSFLPPKESNVKSRRCETSMESFRPTVFRDWLLGWAAVVCLGNGLFCWCENPWGISRQYRVNVVCTSSFWKGCFGRGLSFEGFWGIDWSEEWLIPILNFSANIMFKRYCIMHTSHACYMLQFCSLSLLPSGNGHVTAVYGIPARRMTCDAWATIQMAQLDASKSQVLVVAFLQRVW